MSAHNLGLRNVFERRNGRIDDPGATIIWFGDYNGERFDKLTEEYCQSLLYLELTDPRWRQFIRDVCNSYTIYIGNQANSL